MLKNPELFKNVETGLRSMGTIKAFEDEHGKILGRAMITLTDIPESIEVKRTDRENLTAFEITFDFCNVALGIVVDTKKKTLESSVWGRYQAPNAQRPSDEWVKFFIRTLFENIAPTVHMESRCTPLSTIQRTLLLYRQRRSQRTRY